MVDYDYLLFAYCLNMLYKLNPNFKKILNAIVTPQLRGEKMDP
jgi:hypothetical protein